MGSELIDKNHYRKFGLTMGIVIALLFGLLFPVLFNKLFYFWPWIVASVFVVLALVLPNSLVIVYRPWMLFSEVLGFINSRIILGLVFFTMITPISLVLSLLRKDPMKRKAGDDKQGSYWVDSLSYEKDDMERIY